MNKGDIAPETKSPAGGPLARTVTDLPVFPIKIGRLFMSRKQETVSSSTPVGSFREGVRTDIGAERGTLQER